MDLYNIKESEKDERQIDVSVSYLEVMVLIGEKADLVVVVLLSSFNFKPS